MNSTVVFVASILTGAKVACVDPFIAYIDAKAQIDLVKPKIIFITSESVERIEKIIDELGLNTEIIVFGESDKHTSFNELLKPFSEDEEENFEPYTAKDIFDTVLVVFSSGSTGVPKGICVNHYAVLCSASRMM